jgi:aspartyl protease family protein
MRLLPLILLLAFILLIAKMGVSVEKSNRELIAANERGLSMSEASAVRQSSNQRSDGGRSVTLRRAPDSHFYAEARMNGQPIKVMVDSGASMVALRRVDAQKMGINVDSLPIKGEARTAGGVVPMRVLTLRVVDVGGIRLENVAAAIVDLPPDQDMPATLLGQSYLSRLASMEVRGDEMVMR